MRVFHLPGGCAISVGSILDSPTDKEESTDERNVDEIPNDHGNVKMDFAMFGYEKVCEWCHGVGGVS